ncbi:MAG: hypothetical protein K5694_00260 [Bacilli bacterium]|nr:hypothetical protein [Bacilli bacterium]
MKNKFLDISYRAIVIHIYVFVALVSLMSGLTVYFKNDRNLVILFAILSFVIALVYVAYIITVVIRFADRSFHNLVSRDKKNLIQGVATTFKNRKIIRAMTGGIFGAIINLSIALFYIALTAVYGSGFYLTVAILYLFSFSARIIMLSYGSSPNKKQETNAMVFAAIFTMLIGLMTLGIAIYIHLGRGTFYKNYFVIYIIAIYTFVKLIAAIRNFFKTRNNHNSKGTPLILISYSMITLSLALFSLYVLQVEMLNCFGSASDIQKYAPIGETIASIIIALGIYGVYKAIRSKIKLKKEEENQPIELDATEITELDNKN